MLGVIDQFKMWLEQAISLYGPIHIFFALIEEAGKVDGDWISLVSLLLRLLEESDAFLHMVACILGAHSHAT